MSVKGFQVGNTVEKYDYNELANPPTIPTKTSDLINDSDFLPVVGASSARNGDVVVYDGPNSRWIVDAPPTIPTKTSDLNNDSGFVNASGAASAAPVQSVNGQTGTVTLAIPSSAADVGAIAAPASPATGAFLVWSGTAWVAQTLSTWQGGSY